MIDKCLFTKGGGDWSCLVTNHCLKTSCFSLVVGLGRLWETLSLGIRKHCRNIRSTFYRKNTWRNIGSWLYCRKINTCQLCILLLARCQTSQACLETNSVCWDALKNHSAIGMSIRELTQMSSPSPSNLPLILLLCCHCRSYCSKVKLWASVGSVGSMSEAERKKIKNKTNQPTNK